MRLGNREGYFVLDTGATRSAVDAWIFGRPAGSKLALSGSSFPSVRGGDFAVIDFGETNDGGASERVLAAWIVNNSLRRSVGERKTATRKQNQ